MCSKKDYVAIAAIIRERSNQAGRYAPNIAEAMQAELAEAAKALAHYFADDSPRFDRPRFIAACTGEWVEACPRPH